MIVVLDTNVIVSALLSPSGPPGQIMNLWEADKLEVATSPQLLAELERVLEYAHIRGRFEDPQSTGAFLKRFRSMATVVEPQLDLDVIEEDPTDNRFLECAVAASASYIISGGDHLLAIKKYREIVILRPAVFLTIVEQR